MAMTIGDPTFSHTGMPGTIRKKEAEQGAITVETDPQAVQTEHRHGYLTGFTPNERASFTQIMDKVKDERDPKEKMRVLQNQIDTLETETDPQKRNLLRYLHSELFHIMDTYRIAPREYTKEE